MKLTHLSLIVFAALSLSASAVLGQSSNQDYPTPVTTTEINGTIKARDIGDARLTTYYYQFDGDQGDLFINIVTQNFTGDIDVFVINGLRPLTKIVVYADLAEHETGRVIYLRKPEKMILRIQGRTPGDDAATFRIKFAGSFVASTMAEPPGQPELPSVTAKNDSGITVNSVGTIVAVKPKPTPVPPPVVATEPSKSEPSKTGVIEIEESRAKNDEEAKPKHEVVITDDVGEKPAATTPPAGRRSARNRRGTPPKTTPVEAGEAKPRETEIETPTETATVPPKTTPSKTTPRAGRGGTTTPPKGTEPDPLANINLVIQFKDGAAIHRPMSEVLRFSVDKGILTVIGKDGTIGRYSILDVEKVTIQ